MKIKLLPVIAASVLLCASCIPSVEPLLTEADLVFEPGLIGKWEDEGTWTFSKREADATDKTYKLVIVDKKGQSAEFTALLGRIGGKLFLDIVATDLGAAGENMCAWAVFSLIPGHLFFRIWDIGAELKLSLPRIDQLTELLKKDPKALAHRFVGADGLVLTAPTAELQAFFIQHADDDAIFNARDAKDKGGMKRVPAAGETK
jgi:hypothetical protein